MLSVPDIFSKLNGKVQKVRRLQHERARRRIRSVRREFYAELWQQASQRLNINYHRVSPYLHRLSKGEACIEIIGGAIEFDKPAIAESIGDKQVLFEAYAALGIPSLPHLVFSANNAECALRFMHDQPVACVVKPLRDTGGGQGVTVGVDTPEQLYSSIKHASTYCEDLLIEAEVQGADYRLLYFDGALLDVVRRDRPGVIGDGKRTIKDLILDENAMRLMQKAVTALSLLTLDDDMFNTLAKTGWSLGSIPREGQHVQIKGACNQNASRENHACVNAVHPETESAILSILNHFKARLVGVDLICKDIAAPMTPDNGYICELNTHPGLHHHFLTTRTQAPTHIVDDLVRAALA